MHRLIATLIAVAAFALTAGTARADSGQFTAAGGESCSWYGFGSSADVSCSGYSRGTYVNYSCNYSFFGSSYSYTCRDHHGNLWSGSR